MNLNLVPSYSYGHLISLHIFHSRFYAFLPTKLLFSCSTCRNNSKNNLMITSKTVNHRSKHVFSSSNKNTRTRKIHLINWFLGNMDTMATRH